MRDNSTEYARVIELMAKKMGRIASPEDEEELRRLLSANPGVSYLAEVVASLKGNAEHVEKSVPEQDLASSGWAHLSERMNAEAVAGGRVRRMGWRGVGVLGRIGVSRRIGIVRRMSRVAAVLLFVLAGVGAWFVFRQPAGVGINNSVQVGYGHKKMLVLADGTKVWLNAGSKLIYPTAFRGNTREVVLDGEAFFDVAQQAHQPFFVHTGKITVKVLGTRFDLKAYREDAQVSATLISGKIQVIMNEEPEKKILLSPHEKLTVMNGGEEKEGMENELRYQVQLLSQAERQEVFPETAWVDNKMVFNNETFEEVARQLQRRYAVTIEFDNETLKREHMSGVFEKESLQQALDILKMTTKFNYKIDSNRVKLVADQN